MSAFGDYMHKPADTGRVLILAAVITAAGHPVGEAVSPWVTAWVAVSIAKAKGDSAVEKPAPAGQPDPKPLTAPPAEETDYQLAAVAFSTKHPAPVPGCPQNWKQRDREELRFENSTKGFGIHLVLCASRD